MTLKQLNILGLVAALAVFVAVNLFAGTALRFWRADLTAQDLFTLSEGTRRILENIDEPITVRLFYSEDSAADAPQIATYARRVRELLEEFDAAADGKIVLQVIDPEPFSEAEELALAYGVRGQMISGAGDVLFFGLAATNSVDDVERIPVFDPRGEALLEHQLAKLVHDLTRERKSKVGILSSLPLRGGPAGFPGMQGQQPWQIVSILGEYFDVEFLEAADLTQIPDDLDVLMLVHPKGLSDLARFAIDQYALSGGKVLALVDPYCYWDIPQGQNQFGAPRNSQLDDLLGAWGVELAENRVVGDRDGAMSIRTRSNTLMPFPLWMELNTTRDPEVFSDEDFVTSSLSVTTFFCPGALEAKPEAKVEVTPLMLTSESGKQIDAFQLQMVPDVLQMAPNLAGQFRPVEGEGQRQVLAVRISGEIESAFPDGAPQGWEGEQEVLASSKTPFNAIVIADVDFMQEALWSSSQDVGGLMLRRRNDNPVVILNALENLCGSNDLLSLRSRGVFRRPLEKKDELARRAQELYQAKFQELEVKMQELDSEIRELRKGADESGIVRVTLQQFEELQDKEQEQIEIKREQRQVRHQLIRDIKLLDRRLKVINILLVPALVIAAGVAFHLSRRRRRSA